MTKPTASSDWFCVEVFEWMWREDGLGLRPGAELMVYATIYRASAHGGGAFVATNASMGVMLGYPRETICRTVGKLLKAGLVWTVGRIHDGHGGKPVKCYAVCQPAIERVQGSISARHLLGHLSATGARPPLLGDAPLVVPEPAAAATKNDAIDAKGTGIPLSERNVTDGHVAPATSGAFLQTVTDRHANEPMHDNPSRERRDDTSQVTVRHIAKNDPLPATLPTFGSPPISTYHLSTDQCEKNESEGGRNGGDTHGPSGPLAVCGHALSAADLVAFRSLVERSLRPVDPDYMEQNLLAFSRVISEGVTADVVLTAYDEYAEYQRRMMRELGEFRPMHLLNWLRQRPNKNIQYVINRLDDEWRRTHARARQASRGTDAQPRPTHENPNLVRCVDHGTRLWFVTDERGSRYVEGSRGVESPTRALALYEDMYESEQEATRRAV